MEEGDTSSQSTYTELEVQDFLQHLRELPLARCARAARLDGDGRDGNGNGDERVDETVGGTHDPVLVDHDSAAGNNCQIECS